MFLALFLQLLRQAREEEVRIRNLVVTFEQFLLFSRSNIVFGKDGMLFVHLAHDDDKPVCVGRLSSDEICSPLECSSEIRVFNRTLHHLVEDHIG